MKRMFVHTLRSVISSPTFKNTPSFGVSKLHTPITATRTFASARTQLPTSENFLEPLPEFNGDPFALLEDDLKDIYVEMRDLIRKNTSQNNVYDIAAYYLDGQGKAFRPMLAMLMAKAINWHLHKDNSYLQSQRDTGMVAELIHTASLIHDDLLDLADSRRGKPSVNIKWNHKKVTMAGDFVLGIALMLSARLNNTTATQVLNHTLSELIHGEFMQALFLQAEDTDRFECYLEKSFAKTGSLIANALKVVAILAEGDEDIINIGYQYGRNLGLAFQLADDVMDFVSSSELMGKPAAADLKLGLVTAPVLFASETYPELHPLIDRKFKQPGDVETAFNLVLKSDGLKKTQQLANEHCNEAIRLVNLLAESPYQEGLVCSARLAVNRLK